MICSKHSTRKASGKATNSFLHHIQQEISRFLFFFRCFNVSVKGNSLAIGAGNI